jgi:integrase
VNAIALSDFRERVIARYRVTKRKRDTRVRMATLLSEFLTVFTPDDDTSSIDGDSIVRWMERYGAGRKTGTTIGYLGVLRAAINYGMRQHWVDRSKEPDWKGLRPRHRRRVGPHLPFAEAQKLLLYHRQKGLRGTWLDRRTYVATAIGLFTGLRRNELLCLEWANVDLELGIISVEGHQDDDLKTEASVAPVPIPPELLPDLIAWRAENPGRYVLRGVRGDRPWRGGRCGHRPIDTLRAAGRECGVKVNDWQTLRRTWATLGETLFGLTDPQIERVLRHTSPLTSKRHYRAADVAALREIGKQVTFFGSIPAAIRSLFMAESEREKLAKDFDTACIEAYDAEVAYRDCKKQAAALLSVLLEKKKIVAELINERRNPRMIIEKFGTVPTSVPSFPVHAAEAAARQAENGLDNLLHASATGNPIVASRHRGRPRREQPAPAGGTS